jgi:hypothetical protein
VAQLNRSLDEREKPKAEVVHYESPPRRRLRKAEDKVLEDINGIFGFI